jgi:hypothetical protein
LNIESLAEARIYFGHQSVGRDIVNGIQQLINCGESPPLHIVESCETSVFKQPGLVHSRIGRNTHPYEKIQDFISIITNGIGNQADVAFFKFCYVDFNESTDEVRIFDKYVATLNELKIKYPGTLFIHCTVPLTIVHTSLKTRIKTLLRLKNIWEYASNIKRNCYNEKLLGYYAGKEPVFDLAKKESSTETGGHIKYSYCGKQYFSLNPELACDDGHLNDDGKLKVARELLFFLNNLVIKKT